MAAWFKRYWRHVLVAALLFVAAAAYYRAILESRRAATLQEELGAARRARGHAAKEEARPAPARDARPAN